MAQDPAAPPAERRSDPRRSLLPGVATEVRRLRSGDNLARLALNVSIGGLCVVTSEPLKAGEFIEVLLSAPGLPETIHIAGRVAWCASMEGDPSQWRLGIAFIRKLSAADLARLVSP